MGDPVQDAGARVTGQINRYDVGFIAMKTEDAQTGWNAH